MSPIYSHFASKEGLFEAAIRDRTDRVMGGVAGALDPTRPQKGAAGRRRAVSDDGARGDVQKRGVAVTDAMNGAALGVGAVFEAPFEAASAHSRRTSGLQSLERAAARQVQLSALARLRT